MPESPSRVLQMERTEPRWIRINCGGQVFETSVETVTKFPNSKLAGLFMTGAGAEVERKEDCTLDMDPQCFRSVLTWLR